MKEYIHKVHYYETDRMGITHHSNYIRWMEEARMDYLEQIGCGYAHLEELGLMSPVLSVDCKYKLTTKFTDQIAISVKLRKFDGIRMTLDYEMHNLESGELVSTGSSSHCFLGEDFKPVRFRKKFPEIYEKLKSYEEPVLERS